MEGSGADAEGFANVIMNAICKIDGLCENEQNDERDKSEDESGRGSPGRGILLPMIVGGCCRTTPETISAVRKRIDSYERDQSSP